MVYFTNVKNCFYVHNTALLRNTFEINTSGFASVTIVKHCFFMFILCSRIPTHLDTVYCILYIVYYTYS